MCEGRWGGDYCDRCMRGWAEPKCDKCLENFAGENCDKCKVGWSGPNCEFPDSSVTLTPGTLLCKHGKFMDGACACEKGWSGVLCNIAAPKKPWPAIHTVDYDTGQEDTSYCVRRCSGHGRCDLETRTCDCDASHTGEKLWTGEYCEKGSYWMEDWLNAGQPVTVEVLGPLEQGTPFGNSAVTMLQRSHARLRVLADILGTYPGDATATKQREALRTRLGSWGVLQVPKGATPAVRTVQSEDQKQSKRLFTLVKNAVRGVMQKQADAAAAKNRRPPTVLGQPIMGDFSTFTQPAKR